MPSEPVRGSEFRPVLLARALDANAPSRFALDLYHAVEAGSVSLANEGELVGIDVFV